MKFSIVFWTEVRAPHTEEGHDPVPVDGQDLRADLDLHDAGVTEGNDCELEMDINFSNLKSKCHSPKAVLRIREALFLIHVQTEMCKVPAFGLDFLCK